VAGHGRRPGRPRAGDRRFTPGRAVVGGRRPSRRSRSQPRVCGLSSKRRRVCRHGDGFCIDYSRTSNGNACTQ
jgi:hypothetical protein